MAISNNIISKKPISENLWKIRKPPVPLSWEAAASHQGDTEADDETDVRKTDMEVWSIGKCAKVFSETIFILKKELMGKTFLVWDKDDKPAMDFVTACANIRAHIFSIQTKSRFAVKCKFIVIAVLLQKCVLLFYSFSFI